jgi:hypothetical protein
MAPDEAVEAILHHVLEMEWGILYEFMPHLDVEALRSACLTRLAEAATARERIRCYFLLSELGASCLPEAQTQILRRDLEENDSELRVGALGCAVACHVRICPPTGCSKSPWTVKTERRSRLGTPHGS